MHTKRPLFFWPGVGTLFFARLKHRITESTHYLPLNTARSPTHLEFILLELIRPPHPHRTTTH